MNAYELADDVKNISNTIEALEWVQKASFLLIQQANRIKQLELQLFKATNRAIANRKKANKLKKEKIRAYDNGYEDGRKPNTQSLTQLHPLSDEEIVDICESYRIYITETGIKAVRKILERHGIK